MNIEDTELNIELIASPDEDTHTLEEICSLEKLESLLKLEKKIEDKLGELVESKNAIQSSFQRQKEKMSTDNGESKWIYFDMIAQKAKTQVWNVVAKKDNLVLGHIAWFSRWRQYAFFPTFQMVFTIDCLHDITSFISKLMKQRNATQDFGINMRDVDNSVAKY